MQKTNKRLIQFFSRYIKEYQDIEFKEYLINIIDPFNEDITNANLFLPLTYEDVFNDFKGLTKYYQDIGFFNFAKREFDRFLESKNIKDVFYQNLDITFAIEEWELNIINTNDFFTKIHPTKYIFYAFSWGKVPSLTWSVISRDWENYINKQIHECFKH